MSFGLSPRGSALKIVSLSLAAVILIGGGYFAYLRTRPRPLDPRLDGINVDIVPPPGEKPFDPKPLMDKVGERITTNKFRFAVLGDSKHAGSTPMPDTETRFLSA